MYFTNTIDGLDVFKTMLRIEYRFSTILSFDSNIDYTKDWNMLAKSIRVAIMERD